MAAPLTCYMLRHPATCRLLLDLTYSTKKMGIQFLVPSTILLLFPTDKGFFYACDLAILISIYVLRSLLDVGRGGGILP